MVGRSFARKSASVLLVNGDEGFAESAQAAYQFDATFDARSTTVAINNTEIARTYRVVTYGEPPVPSLVDTQTGQTANFVLIERFADVGDGG